MMRYFFILFLFQITSQISAQETLIDTVIIDNQLKKSGEISKINFLNADKILENTTSLSDLLRNQSNIYIKENGRGAVSSPSFRGTTAQQTAFVWNGINVNSIFLGQGDINNLNILSYDNLAVKYGGGSVLYGSGAIGGSIHLNNILDFDKGFSASLFSEYASFGTSNSFIKAKYSNEKLSFSFSANHSQSENDYEVPEKNYININGQYKNIGINLGLALKVNRNSEIYWQSQHYDSSQHYPVFEESYTKTKYLVQTLRSLAGWKMNLGNIHNDLKVAYLEDNFQYFADIDKAQTSGGTGKQYIIRNDFDLSLWHKTSINFISEYQYNTGEGYQSGIGNVKRNIGSFALLFRNQNSEKFYWEIGTKKDVVEGYQAPFLYSGGAKYTVTKWYQASVNLSKNFRAPTFNDLYWQPGGNTNLKPETSYQAEISQTLHHKNIKLIITPYYMYIKDNIIWVPGFGGLWSPQNIRKTKAYGIETQLAFEKKMGSHSINSVIAYTFSKSVDMETNKQLMYVPLHKINLNADYHYKIFGVFLQAIFNGKTFTDNYENMFLKEYVILNAGMSVNPVQHFTIGAKINNIGNQIYATTNYYYMPKRNFSIYLKINF